MSVAGILVNQLAAFVPSALMAELKIRKKLATLQERLDRNELFADNDPKAALPPSVLLQYHDGEIRRRVGIEDKAKKNLVGVTVAVSVISAGIGILTGNDTRQIFAGSAAIWAGAILLAGIGFLILGALTALRALRIDTVYGLTLSDESQGEGARAALLLLCIELNQLKTAQRSNWVFASDACIRNGLFALGAFSVAAAALIFLARSTPPTSQDAVKDGVVLHCEPEVTSGRTAALIEPAERSSISPTERSGPTASPTATTAQSPPASPEPSVSPLPSGEEQREN